MSTPRIDPLVYLETTCRTLLDELQIIWDEIGETHADRDEMLLELERECVEVYRRKVDQANLSRARIRQTIADYEAELAAICSAMGERPVHIRQSDLKVGSLKEELGKILPLVEEVKKRKMERINHFTDVLDQIQMIRNGISGSTESVSSETLIDETDLSLMKLEELHRELHELQKEKSHRLKQVQDHLNVLSSLCSVMGMDFKLTVAEVHPSLGDSEGSWSISNNTIEQLGATVNKLREAKIQRRERLQDLATTMLELWNLMDTPIEEQQKFQDVTCNVAASEDEITEPNSLSEDFINYVEAEVSRLEELKSSKMKELVLKKRSELREICRKTHLVPDTELEDVIEAIEFGVVDAATVLEQIELHIAKFKEEAFSRKEILEKVEKWLAACDEECWLEEYNRDEKRYNLGKGTHLTLKRAEKARALVNKLPGMTETLISKTVAWEEEKETEFLYDGVRALITYPLEYCSIFAYTFVYTIQIHLLSMLEDYAVLREEKEQERRRLRDQKKLQGQIIVEQEVLYGSKPTPSKPPNAKKISKQSSLKRSTSGGTMLKTDSVSTPRTPQIRSSKKSDLPFQNDRLNHRQDDAIPASPAFRRGMDSADTPFRKHSSNSANEVESPLKTVPVDDLLDTLPRLKITTSLVDEENQTLKTMHSTETVPMQTDTTQASDHDDTTKQIKGSHEEMEESLEERRRACYPPGPRCRTPCTKQSRETEKLAAAAMGRMHSRGKGISASALPYKRTPPSWLKISSQDVEENICKFAKKGLTPSQIGVILRDSHGIAQVKSVTGSKILRILKAHGLAPEIPEDLYHLIKKAVAIRKHLERNRKDKDSKFRLILVESRIHRLARYYKKTKKLPPVWKYESTTASTLVA
ncbi:hypothetical protein V6N11_009776 [Hibiscus sabdariffa]|uniref:Small ribosomal subunit protein uS15 N-terminal domain-containing protein n=1 Tax=Hibiscus sabdariffa TaxID=183260 RepID=A0ABR2P6C1_9ROSI